MKEPVMKVSSLAMDAAAETMALQMHAIGRTVEACDASDYFRHASYLSMVIMHSRIIEKIILAKGVTGTQYRILLRLLANDGLLRAGQLAEMLDLGASAVTASVSQLQDSGTIVRRDSAEDRRAVHVILTPFGIALTHDIQETLSPLLERFFNDIPADLQSYAKTCTLTVAEKNGLLGMGARTVSCKTAMCDEMLLTANLATHITRDEGLSLTGYRLLLELFDKTCGARPNELASSLGVKNNGIAMAQTELLRRQFIDRTRDPRDRRAILIEITSDGYAVLRRTAKAVSCALDTQILPDLDAEDFEKHRRIAQRALEMHRPRLV